MFEKEEEESRKSEKYLTTPPTSIVKKESLKGDCIGKYVVVYFDDYLRHLREVFLVLKVNSLFANSDKCVRMYDFKLEGVNGLKGFFANFLG